MLPSPLVTAPVSNSGPIQRRCTSSHHSVANPREPRPAESAPEASSAVCARLALGWRRPRPGGHARISFWPRRSKHGSKGRSIGEVVTAVAHVFAQRQPPLELLAAGILLARLVGIHRKSWAQTIIGRIRPPCRVERTIGAGGPVAPWHTLLRSGSAKPYSPSLQKSWQNCPRGA